MLGGERVVNKEKLKGFSQRALSTLGKASGLVSRGAGGFRLGDRGQPFSQGEGSRRNRYKVPEPRWLWCVSRNGRPGVAGRE